MYRLIEDWQFEHRFIVPILIVPKGYQTDLASIPDWAFWWKRGKYDIAAIAHDYVCDYGCLLTAWAKDFPFTRAEGDRLFYDVCLAVGVNPITAMLMYWAVRIYSVYDGTKRKIKFSRKNRAKSTGNLDS
ncbi:MAG: DUF1353 domain-containing protein [Cyanobacteria bacterium P01_A01_bin.40]